MTQASVLRLAAWKSSPVCKAKRIFRIIRAQIWVFIKKQWINLDRFDWPIRKSGKFKSNHKLPNYVAHIGISSTTMSNLFCEHKAWFSPYIIYRDGKEKELCFSLQVLKRSIVNFVKATFKNHYIMIFFFFFQNIALSKKFFWPLSSEKISSSFFRAQKAWKNSLTSL